MTAVEMRRPPSEGGLFDWELHAPEQAGPDVPSISVIDEQMVLAVLARQPEQCVRDLVAGLARVLTHHRRRYL